MTRFRKAEKEKGSRFSWRSRLMGMILLVVLSLFSISFICAYEIFIKKLEETNFKATTQAFKQTEHNIDYKLAGAAESANRLLARTAAFDFLTVKGQTLPEETLAAKRAADALSECLSSNPELAGVALIDGKGKGLGVTAWGMTAADRLTPDHRAYRFLERAKDRYPYYIWFGAGETRTWFADLPGFSDFFEDLSGDPVPMLVGVRMISYGNRDEGSAYLLLTVKEVAVQQCYSNVLYNQNTMVLLDQSRQILSSMDNRKRNEPPAYGDRLGADKTGSFRFRMKTGGDFQMLYYSLPQYHWILIDEIPKSSYRKQAYELKLILLILWFFTLSLLLLFFIVWIGKYTRPVERLIHSMKRVQAGDLSPVRFPPSGIPEMDQLGEQFGITVTTIDSLISRVRSMDKEIAKEELRTLQYQINPHFLYNSLSSIRWMAVLNNNPKIADALLLLARLMEPVLRSPSFYWTVGEELEFVSSYVRMLTLRFGGALVYKTECDPALNGRVFPRFTLQPILENCFTHGMIPGDTLHIRVSITLVKRMLHIQVINTGNHIEPEKLAQLNDLLERRREPEAPAGSIGLLNVNKRLFLLYGLEAGMRIRSADETDTVVELEVPGDGVGWEAVQEP